MANVEPIRGHWPETPLRQRITMVLLIPFFPDRETQHKTHITTFVQFASDGGHHLPESFVRVVLVVV